jgi:hypothetical protein
MAAAKDAVQKPPFCVVLTIRLILKFIIQNHYQTAATIALKTPLDFAPIVTARRISESSRFEIIVPI